MKFFIYLFVCSLSMKLLLNTSIFINAIFIGKNNIFLELLNTKFHINFPLILSIYRFLSFFLISINFAINLLCIETLHFICLQYLFLNYLF